MTENEYTVKMTALIEYLNTATEAYNKGKPIMTDQQWDDYYFELQQTEEEAGFALPNSPTQQIYVKSATGLNIVEHNHLMLSLEKTRDCSEKNIRKYFKKDTNLFAMLKCDGLTCSLLYREGKLVRAETRGNGEKGEDITHNAYVIDFIPNRIPCTDEVIVDGEIVIQSVNFEKYFADKYENPRNFAAGSIRLLNNTECAQRMLDFVVWDWINSPKSTFSESFATLERWGFITVPRFYDNIFDLENLRRHCQRYGIPSDGIVYKPENRADISGEHTAHHFKDAVAFKFADEVVETTLIDVEWNTSKQGWIVPVAIFEPCRLYDTTVQRASLFNADLFKQYKLTKGCKIKVTKSNMIIPHVVEKVEDVSDELIPLPTVCPCCKFPLKKDGVHLVCDNPTCGDSIVQKLDYFCSKKALDIKGLSTSTLERLYANGWVETYEDIFYLHQHKKEWAKMEGFGEISVQKILDAINKAIETPIELYRFLCAFNIPTIGETVSKEICKNIPHIEGNTALQDLEDCIKNKTLPHIPRITGIRTINFYSFDYTALLDLGNKLFHIINTQNSNIIPSSEDLNGYNICITGKLNQFKNRDELKQKIEQAGGKVCSSVTKNTTLLINNDINSTTAKNVSAERLGIPILTEQEFINRFF